MFNPGNKIVVTCSSIKKGVIGPRECSIGYVKRSIDASMDLDNYMIFAMNVIFYKFGNDKKYRVEQKIIPFLFAKELEKKNNFNFNNQRSFINQLQNNKKLKTMIGNMFGADKLYTVSPVFTNINTDHVTTEELSAYIKSLWTKENLGKFLNNIKLGNWHHRYKLDNIESTIKMLAKGINNLTYRKDAIKNIIKSKSNSMSFIDIIKLVTLRQTRISNIMYMLNQNGQTMETHRYKDMYRTLCGSLFDIKYKTLTKNYTLDAKNPEDRKAMDRIINNLNEIKHTVINIGYKYTSIT